MTYRSIPRAGRVDRRIAFSAAFLLVAVSKSALALTVTYSDSTRFFTTFEHDIVVDNDSTFWEGFSYYDNLNNPSLTNKTAISLPKFDASLGILTGAVLRWEDRSGGIAQFIDTLCVDNGAFGVDCAEISLLLLQGAFTTGIEVPEELIADPIDLMVGTSQHGYGGHYEFSFNPSTTYYSALGDVSFTSTDLPFATNSVNLIALSSLTGPGTFDFYLTSLSSVLGAGINCDASIGAARVGCETTVQHIVDNNWDYSIEYQYKEFPADPPPPAVPLPASMPLMLAGLGGLAWLGRR